MAVIGYSRHGPSGAWYHVGLSRPVNEYERKELAEFHIDTDEENRYFAVISETTLEFVRDGIDKYHAPDGPRPSPSGRPRGRAPGRTPVLR
jgi:hypothetical protein